MAYGRTVPQTRIYALRAVRKRLAACVGLSLFAVALAAPCLAQTAEQPPIKGTVEGKVTDGDFGYARIVVKLDAYDDVTARISNNVLIVNFDKPVALVVDRLPQQISDYVGAARRDPDGRAFRAALAKNVKVNAIAAGEKIFIDLLPDTWSGPPPGLPQDVIEDLARRARLADKLERKEQQAVQQQAAADPVKVRVAIQPTFTRYIFNVPPNTAVSADRDKERLTLTFDAPIKFDLGDVQAALPKTVSTLDSQTKDASSQVSFTFAPRIDVRTFRDDNGYDVDVVSDEARADQPSGILSAPKQAAPSNPSPAAPAVAPSQKQGAADNAGPSVAAVDSPAIDAPATIPASNPAPEAKAATNETPPPAPAPAAPVSEKPAAETLPPKTATQTAEAAEQPKPEVQTSPAVAQQPPVQQAQQAAMPVAAPANVAPEPAKDAAPSAAQNPPRVAVELVRQGANLKLSFPFLKATAAAVFRRADTLWVVFDSNVDMDLSALADETSRTIRGVTLTRTADTDIVRIKLDHPHLSTVDSDGSVWMVQIGDNAINSTRALDISRSLVGANRASVTVPFEEPHLVHHIDDPDAGDRLVVVTGYAPARGFVSAKDFVEFRALASAQGIVIDPLADDIKVDLKPDMVVIGRPAGLALSTSVQTLLRGSGLKVGMFDSQLWGSDRQASYIERQSTLLAAAADAPEGKRLAPRLDLARFFIACGMYPEAKGVLDVALTEDHPAAETVSATVLRAVAEIMMNRDDDALKDLSAPVVGDQHDAPLWRALVYAHQGKWGQARDGFKSSEASVGMLPIELQRVALRQEMRSAIETGDFNTAANQLNDFQTIGVPHELEPAMAVLVGRLAEGVGRTGDALAAYRTAADSWDRRAAAQGQLRETLLRYSLGDLKRDEAVSQLETLTTVWRGDDTEIEALQMLARLYTEQGRYRDSFYVMRAALSAHPNSDLTRRIQQEAAKTFDALFLSGKGDKMPAIEALALFYDFRELTPIGRRGDEMIRRLTDRLVSVDLLDQAAELLQYQVDNRLQGAARAQIATRLSVIYLLNRKADRALAALRSTRSAELSDELRNQRLLLEARALSDMGRHDVALEVIGNIDGREAIRLRSDIYWAARRWQESAEQIELMYGERWKDWQPLNETERADILRAEVGYALGEDNIGLDRFREKYAAKMAETPDAHAFQVASAPLGASGAEFTTIAHAAAAVDTLEGFLRDMHARYPDASSLPPADAPAIPDSRPSASNDLPSAKDLMPAAPVPPARAAGRTAQR
jgi:tetratricopeptide (TPR) repeat protein